MYLVFHDNGMLEVADEGGIEKLLNGYAQSNVTVFGWEN